MFFSHVNICNYFCLEIHLIKHIWNDIEFKLDYVQVHISMTMSNRMLHLQPIVNWNFYLSWNYSHLHEIRHVIWEHRPFHVLCSLMFTMLGHKVVFFLPSIPHITTNVQACVLLCEKKDGPLRVKCSANVQFKVDLP